MALNLQRKDRTETVTFLTKDDISPLNFESVDTTTTDSETEESQFSVDELERVFEDIKLLNFEDGVGIIYLAYCYRDQGRAPIFNFVVLNMGNRIMSILDDKCAPEKQEEFKKALDQCRFEALLPEIQQQALEFYGGVEWWGSEEVEEVLENFNKLKFNLEGDLCTDVSDFLNFNKGLRANPFDKIANFYREKNIFLFHFVMLSYTEQIMDIAASKLGGREEKLTVFLNRLTHYLFRIWEGISSAEELQKDADILGFFDGRYLACNHANRPVNHYDILNILIKCGVEHLETRHIFSDKSDGMAKGCGYGEVDCVRVWNRRSKMLTINRVEGGAWDYCFEKGVECKLVINWIEKSDLEDMEYSVVVLNGASVEVTINGKNVEGWGMVELLRKNKEVLVGGKRLHEMVPVPTSYTWSCVIT